MALSVTNESAEPAARRRPAWQWQPRPWGAADWVALLVWTLAIGAFFSDLVTLRRALFYFDVTEINLPYRDFFARELKAGRFSRWCPGLYCGHPLYSESQAGYLHPLKYLLYPWLETWQAFNLDTVLSIWLTGLGTYGWLRRHVGPAGALAGAAVFGLSGFVWAHLIHTSMNNALTSVPFILWGLEAAWESGRPRGLVVGAVAMACQVFAGHLQDTLLTAMAVALYGLYRAATERNVQARVRALGFTAGLLGLGIALSAVQWVPSKELLDRSPRSGGLTWDRLTYGSWHPELLPTLVVREAYGTRARNTDWMDGFYPYQEMDTYMGLLALGLAVVGGAAYRDRWVGFWVLLAGCGGVLMLGRHTILLDAAHRIPILGSSRIPVRLHLWVSLAVAALAAVGVDRLGRPGTVRLRGATVLAVALIAASAAILLHVYAPVWTEPHRWSAPSHRARFHWLGQELLLSTFRTAVVGGLGWIVAIRAAHSTGPVARQRWAAVLPVLIIIDLLGAHAWDIPRIDPSYWTSPPASARLILADPSHQRVLGVAEKASGEPGFASAPVDFFAVRDTLDWSLPIVWGLATARGETPIVGRRGNEYREHTRPDRGRFQIEGVSHVLSGRPDMGIFGRGTPAGAAFVCKVPSVKPRVRLMGRPYYVGSEGEAVGALDDLGALVRDRLVVEDPDRPLAADARAAGEAVIRTEIPERVEVETRSDGDAYLFLADSYDPGWSATLDGRAVPIRPAYVAFRAVFVPKGKHTVVFRYEPAGFRAGLAVSGLGLLGSLLLLWWPRRLAVLADEHGTTNWPRAWPGWELAAIALIVLASIAKVGPSGSLALQDRWTESVHRFTWGAGIEAMRSPMTH